jgi:hypothetical protein
MVDSIIDRRIVLVGVVLTVGLLLLNSWVFWSWKKVAVRKLTCDDLPLTSDQSVASCETALGEFMLEEKGLFTR